MDTTHCKHLRIRNYSDNDMDVEKFIKMLERQYKFDFRSLPDWKNIIEMMYIMQTNYKHKLKDAARRKYEIIEKLNKEYSRLSPFQLTDRLTRTAKKWELMKSNLKKHKVTLKSEISLDQELIKDDEYSGEESEVKSTAHPNTEAIQSKEVLVSKPDVESDLKSISTPHLPISICTNPHKKLSSIGSIYSGLSYIESDQLENTVKSQITEDNIEFIYQRKAIFFFPNELNITNTNQEQSVKLIITNCSIEYVYIRFKGILDAGFFKTFRIIPATPTKLYPGLSFTFKFVFKLRNYKEIPPIKTMASFKIGHNIYSESKDDILRVPIISKVIEIENVKVTGTVCIPPAYKWHVTAQSGYPKGVGQIQVDDNAIYHLHIRKKEIDFGSPESSIESSEKISHEDSLVLKEDNQIVQNELVHTNTKMTSVSRQVNIEENLIKTTDIVTPLLEDVLNLSFGPFVFKHTYLRLLPKSTRIFQVYFTKPEHIGYHHNYYDFEFRNFDTNEMVVMKTIKIFAEVLPHPITINPKILEMSQSSITFGYCKNYFTITNTHKIYPVTIKIKTTTKMKKIFRIKPMETLIPNTSSMKFEVSSCLKHDSTNKEPEELSYFTIKIIVCGHESIYRNSPPLFYEIIAPCAREFKQIYGRRYFRD